MLCKMELNLHRKHTCALPTFTYFTDVIRGTRTQFVLEESDYSPVTLAEVAAVS